MIDEQLEFEKLPYRFYIIKPRCDIIWMNQHYDYVTLEIEVIKGWWLQQTFVNDFPGFIHEFLIDVWVFLVYNYFLLLSSFLLADSFIVDR